MKRPALILTLTMVSLGITVVLFGMWADQDRFHDSGLMTQKIYEPQEWIKARIGSAETSIPKNKALLGIHLKNLSNVNPSQMYFSASGNVWSRWNG